MTGKRVLILLSFLASAGLAFALWRYGGRGPKGVGRLLPEHIKAIVDDRPGAVPAARAAALADWNAAAPIVRSMLKQENWRVRATACAIIARHAPADHLGELVTRCSDSDWRVRAAAFSALATIHPVPEQAMLRETQLPQRERILLDWLDAHDARAAVPLGRLICELYADNPHAEYGAVLVAKCLGCHAAGAAARPADESCGQCHQQIHDQWAHATHAQSLTHLWLKTVNYQQRQPEWFSFGDMRGITCVACHEIDAATPQAAPMPTTGGVACPHRFRKTAGCQSCHADIQRQWEQWRQGPQPRRAIWPPGQVDLDTRDDPRTCVDCHMTKVMANDRTTTIDHRFNVRRNIPFLQQAVDVQIVQSADDAARRQVTLAVTNLTGHEFPTGTRRRAVRLEAGDASRRPLPLVAMLCQVTGELPRLAQPPLKPGERRLFGLQIPPNAAELEFRLTFERDRFVPGAYTAEIVSRRIPLGLRP